MNIYFVATILTLLMATSESVNVKVGKEELKDVEHLKHHLDDQIDTEGELSEEKRRFHYFTMHDINKDGVIDGLELIKAILHTHDDDDGFRPSVSDDELERIVDQVLEEMDTDGNGMVDFPEYFKMTSS